MVFISATSTYFVLYCAVNSLQFLTIKARRNTSNATSYFQVSIYDYATRADKTEFN
jgi:hypothetical protein